MTSRIIRARQSQDYNGLQKCLKQLPMTFQKKTRPKQYSLHVLKTLFYFYTFLQQYAKSICKKMSQPSVASRFLFSKNAVTKKRRYNNTNKLKQINVKSDVDFVAHYLNTQILRQLHFKNVSAKTMQQRPPFVHKLDLCVS